MTLTIIISTDNPDALSRVTHALSTDPPDRGNDGHLYRTTIEVYETQTLVWGSDYAPDTDND